MLGLGTAQEEEGRTLTLAVALNPNPDASPNPNPDPSPNPNPDPDQVLTTPVQFYFGAPFHRSARAALRHCTFNMDVLVSLGTFAAYASPSPAPWT